MEILKELVQIVTKNKLKSIQILDESVMDTKIGAFYNGIAEGNFQSDEEARQFFFGQKTESSAYRKLKFNLKNRLINSLFFIDVKEASYSDRQVAYYQCYKNWAAAKILLGKSAVMAAVEIGESVLKQATKYEFTDICLDVSKVLRLCYGSRIGDQKKYLFYKSLHETYRELDWKEDLAEELYTSIVFNYTRKKAASAETTPKATQSYNELLPHLTTHDSYRLHLYGYLLKLMIHSGDNDYQGILPVCEDMIRFFESKSYVAATPLQIAYYQKLICHRQLGQFEQGRLTASMCLQFVEEGSFNWFKCMEELFELSLYTEHYQDAYITFHQVVHHKRFKFLPENAKEFWKIYEAYLYYLHRQTVLEILPEDKRLPNFRFNKFINEMEIYSKDKSGMNTSIIVIQLLVNLLDANYDKLIDAVESIEKYCYRYLKDESAQRSFLFMKMLLSIPKSGFNKSVALDKADNFYHKLKKIPPCLANQTFKVEIMPYEVLWKMVLNNLGGQGQRIQH